MGGGLGVGHVNGRRSGGGAREREEVWGGACEREEVWGWGM